MNTRNQLLARYFEIVKEEEQAKQEKLGNYTLFIHYNGNQVGEMRGTAEHMDFLWPRHIQYYVDKGFRYMGYPNHSYQLLSNDTDKVELSIKANT
jgi:hypothetical protein